MQSAYSAEENQIILKVLKFGKETYEFMISVHKKRFNCKYFVFGTLF